MTLCSTNAFWPSCTSTGSMVMYSAGLQKLLADYRLDFLIILPNPQCDICAGTTKIGTPVNLRCIQRLPFMYKILHGHAVVPIAGLDLYYCQRSAHGRVTDQKKLKGHVLMNSRTYTQLKEWNSIPQSIASADSAASFNQTKHQQGSKL